MSLLTDKTHDIFLYNLTLQRASNIQNTIHGNFSGSKQQEIIVSRGKCLDVFKPDPVTGKVHVLLSQEMFGIVRSLKAFRLTGSRKDFIVVGSDSGRIAILTYNPVKNQLERVHMETFGKSGCRRIIPGQYCAVDPKGRAVMLAATEKQKLVYILNRDASAKITISSPLEAHKAHTLVFDICGLDVGFENPVFACLELDYEDADADETGEAAQEAQQCLTYYELDLGLNHVSRRWATDTHRTACCLAALYGGKDGPSGVLVGGEDYIEYLHEGLASSSNNQDEDGSDKIVCAIPRRTLHPPNKGILITQMTVHKQKKSKFFALAQSELGDVYKVSIRLHPNDSTKVVGMTISLLDTLPVANALNISKRGVLFIPAEFGDHVLYQFESIDVEDGVATCTSEDTVKSYIEFLKKALVSNDIKNDDPTNNNDLSALTITNNPNKTHITMQQYLSSPENAHATAPKFTPTILQNLRQIHTVENLAPTTGVLVGELAGNEVSPQIYTLNGRGSRSSLRILRHGAAVTELAVSDLPGVPGAVYTIRDNSKDSEGKSTKSKFDKFIIVSFADATIVLSVGETVEEVGKESGFLTQAPTLACAALTHDCGIVQVHPTAVRIIKSGKPPVEWKCPGLRGIKCASANESQVVIALDGGNLIYFEIDLVSGAFEEKKTIDFGTGNDVSCLDVGEVKVGRSRSMFAAVGFRDKIVRIISLEPGKSLLQERSFTTLNARPHTVALQHMPTSVNDGKGGLEDIILTVGLDDGSSIRTGVDPITGAISASPTGRFLGARPVSVSRINIDSSPATLLLSSRPWISRPDPKSGKHVMAPLSYAPLDHGCAFTSEAIAEGIVATSGTTLRILAVEAEGAGLGVSEDEAFNSNRVELRYTPRQMCLLAAGGGVSQEARKLVLVTVESDINDYGMVEKERMGFDKDGNGKGGKDKKKEGGEDGDGMDIDSDEEDVTKKEDETKNDSDKEDSDEDDDDNKESRKTSIRGPIPPKPGHWGSCIRLVDPSDGCSTLDCIETNPNEAALCCASVRFHSRGGEALLAVGSVTDLTLHPLRHTTSHISLYRVMNGERLQLLHRTQVDDGPVLALTHFQGRLMVGIGQTLKLYEMGKRQLLKKSELRGLPTMIKTLQGAGDRAYVGDMMQSMHFVKYDSATSKLILVASDRVPRPITCQELLDMNTVAVGDKFGNISILRLPRGADAGAVDISGNRALWDSSRDDATPRLETLCNYHVGEVVTGMTRASLVAGGSESLIYVTVTGRIGALVPFTSRETVDFYTQLEICMRTDAPRPTGREPQAYRSYYAPIKHVIDGGLCEMYGKLRYEDQKKIADQLEREVTEVTKKLVDTRNALL